jgi:hypothetical protein
MEFGAYLTEHWQPDKDKPNQVLIFDQFEELLTADPTDTKAKAEFFRQVGAALQHPRRWALFSMREDYLAGLDPYVLPVPGRLETRFRLDLLARDAALEAIQQPAATAGVTFRDDAASTLFKNLSLVRVQQPDGTSKWTDGPYAEPILLQVVCRHLWTLKGPRVGEITLELVEAIGNVDEALSEFYASQVEAIAAEMGVSEWDVRDWFENRLITPQGVRTQVLQEPGQSGGLDNDAIERLVRVHLVRPERRRGLTWYELAHDRLIEPVRQSNAEWRVQSLEALRHRYAKMVPETAWELDVPEWQIRDWLDRELVTEQGTRRLVKETQVETEGLKDVADRLVDLGLVRKERRLGDTWYELADDRLIEPIRRSNDRWREKNLSPFYPRAVRWATEPGRSDILLTEGELPEMERWVKEHPERVTPEEAAFLRASQSERTRARSERRTSAERRTNLADLGWGAIFAFEDQEQVPELREALHELLALREEQTRDRFRVYEGPDAYRPDETAGSFLARHGVGPGMADPDKVPYYLLIVGDPETIPWEFQYALAVQNAVGRIHFDRPEEYARYARSVAIAERDRIDLQPQATFFGPQHPGDRATELSSKHLVAPLAEAMRKAWPMWNVEAVLADEATKAKLTRLIGGDQTPALLFTAGHGLHGLLCQDWPGPGHPIEREFSFWAEDVAASARLLGLVAFFWAGSTAGTPRLDDFAYTGFGQERRQIAPRASVAHLPQRLLAHPQGGALAIIGHVDRAWNYSFWYGKAGAQLGEFEETLRRLMDGHTVGSAMEPFSRRYASLSSRLAEELREIHFYGKSADDYELTEMMTSTIDARNYVILGDPAVRLPVDIKAPAAERPTIEPVVVSIEPPSVELQPEPAVEVPLRATELAVFNGIDAASGQYLLPPLSPEELTQILMAVKVDE